MTEETNYFTLVIYDMVNYILSHSGINEAKWQTQDYQVKVQWTGDQ